jgi:hypothetical protein
VTLGGSAESGHRDRQDVCRAFYFNRTEQKAIPSAELIILIVVLVLLCGGGGYYWSCGRRSEASCAITLFLLSEWRRENHLALRQLGATPNNYRLM